MTPQRGGFIPTSIISHKLDCREVLVIDAKRTLSDEIYSEKVMPEFSGSLPLEKFQGKKVLFIDDVIATGETFFLLIQKIKNCNPKEIKSAFLVQNDIEFNKSHLSIVLKPNYLGINANDWVVFPWEQ